MRKISQIQRKILDAIGLNNTQHIQQIQKALNQNYATTHRSINRLEKLNFVWLSKSDYKRPKSPKWYSLTPLGVVEIFLRSNLGEREGKNIIKIWKKNCPRYILYWYDYKEKRILSSIINVLQEMYENIVYLRFENHINWTEKNLIVYRNILDANLLYNIMDVKADVDIDGFINVVNKDEVYKKIWSKYYSTQLLLFNRIKSINKEYFNHKNVMI